MAREVPPVCDHCHVRLSIPHILVECPTYYIPRNRFYPSLMSMPPREGLSFLLSESPTHGARARAILVLGEFIWDAAGVSLVLPIFDDTGSQGFSVS